MKLRTVLLAMIGAVLIVLPSSRVAAQTSQTSDDPKPSRFEAVSVKVNRTGHAGQARDRMGIQRDGSFHGENITVSTLLDVAYSYPNERIVGLPEWTDEEWFDVIAKAPSSVAGPMPQQVAVMMRAMLADRFKLTAHPEMRDGAAYELRLARADGQLGRGLVATDRADCEAIESGRSDRPPTPIDRPHPPCGGSLAAGSFTAGGMRMEQFATGMLTRMLGRPVIDRTGLRDRFDIELTFAFGEMPRSLTFDPTADAFQNDPNRPTLFTSLQEQLGLKLVAVRAPVDVLVIDRIERPDPD